MERQATCMQRFSRNSIRTVIENECRVNWKLKQYMGSTKSQILETVNVINVSLCSRWEEFHCDEFTLQKESRVKIRKRSVLNVKQCSDYQYACGNIPFSEGELLTLDRLSSQNCTLFTFPMTISLGLCCDQNKKSVTEGHLIDVEGVTKIPAQRSCWLLACFWIFMPCKFDKSSNCIQQMHQPLSLWDKMTSDRVGSVQENSIWRFFKADNLPMICPYFCDLMITLEDSFEVHSIQFHHFLSLHLISLYKLYDSIIWLTSGYYILAFFTSYHTNIAGNTFRKCYQDLKFQWRTLHLWQKKKTNFTFFSQIAS